MSNLNAWLDGKDFDGDLIAATDRRRALREAFPGVAHVEFARSGDAGHVLTVDLGEDGLCLVSRIEPRVGESLRIEVAGLVIEGLVRNVARGADGGFRVGVTLD